MQKKALKFQHIYFQHNKAEWIPLAILAGSAIAGGLNAWSNAKSNSANRKATERANMQNYNAQKEFAQNGILWRKQDALRAGINPIYALGASGASFSPSFTATQENPTDFSFIANGINNAVNAYQQEKTFELSQQTGKSEIKKNEAQAQYYTALATKAAGNAIDAGFKNAGSANRNPKIQPRTNTLSDDKGKTQLIDPNSQITQEMSSDGIGVLANLGFASEARAAKKGLELFNKGKMQYPALRRSKSESGQYELYDAGSWQNWYNSMNIFSKIDYNFREFWNNIAEKIDDRTPNSAQRKEMYIRETLNGIAEDWNFANRF